MTPEQSRRDEAGRWLAQAQKDLNAARLLASPEPSRSVFHSQQAAEKAAEAFLVFHDVPFRKTHDLNELGEQCAALDSSLVPLFKEAADLTDYAVLFRYLDSSSTVGDASWPQLVDSKQGDACQREILVSRIICK